jgi:hypothetical protein
MMIGGREENEYGQNGIGHGAVKIEALFTPNCAICYIPYSSLQGRQAVGVIFNLNFPLSTQGLRGNQEPQASVYWSN